MNAKKSVTLTGVAIAIAAGASSHLAMAGIDKGGKSPPPRTASRGLLSRFGSIYVNGVRFNTDSAVFIIDGRFGSESDLDVGQIVSVYGTVEENGDTGTAYLVTYDDAVEGPVANIDTESNRLTVLGQTVVVNNDTAFSIADGTGSVAALADNQVVEVSGYADASGNIVATYIGASAAQHSFDVAGIVTGVDSGSQTFQINGLDVDYSGAELYALPFDELHVGQHLEVVGATSDTTGRFEAHHVWAVEDAMSDQSDVSGELEGLITRRVSLTQLEVNGVTVRLGFGTRFVGGSWFGLSLDRRVEVEGQFDASGILVAETIEFAREAEFEHSGHVQEVYDNMVVVDGVPMLVTNETAFEDDSDDDERRFSVDSLRTGDFVRVRGYESNNNIVATRLERDDNDDDDDDDRENDDD